MTQVGRTDVSSKRPHLLLLAQLSWIVIASFTIVVYLLQMPFYYSNLYSGAELVFSEVGISPSFHATFVTVRDIIVTVSFFIVALSLLRNRSSEPQIIFASIVMLLIGVSIPALLLTESTLLLAVLRSFVYFMGATAFIFFLFVLPDGDFYPVASKYIAIFLSIVIFLVYTVSNFVPQLQWPSNSLFPFTMIWAAVAIVVQVYRYRKYYDVTKKQQTKWMILGFTLTFLGLIAMNIGSDILVLSFSPGAVQVLYDLYLVTIFGLLPALSIPITTSISIRRYRLWDLGDVVGRGLQNLFFFGILLGTLLMLSGVLTPFFLPFIAGLESLFFTVTTIVLVIVFQPLYRGFTLLFDRFYFRDDIDLTRNIESFISQSRITRNVDEVVDLLMKKITSLTDVVSSCVVMIDASNKQELIKCLGASMEIVEYQAAIENNVEKLKQERPVLFSIGNKYAVVIPMIAVHGDERDLVGNICLGERKSGKGFSSRFINQIQDLGEIAGTSIFVSRLTDVVRDREERFRALVDISPDAIVITNIDGTIIAANRQASYMVQYDDPEDMVGQNLFDFLLESDHSMARDELALSSKESTGIPTTTEWTIKRKDGTSFPSDSIAGGIHDPSGEATGWIIIVRDVSERKKNETELKYTKDRALLYLDLLRHDITNQLQVILGGAEIARELATQMGIASSSLIGIGEAAERCEQIIRKIRETEELMDSPTMEMDLAIAIHTAIAEIKERYPSLEIAIDIELKVAPIIADRFIVDMCTNLLENAYIHNDKDQKHIWVKLSLNDSDYVLSISDDGPGIPDRTKAQLFDVTRRYGGVGLHQTREIVEKYNGSIEVADRIEGRPSEGVIFTIRLPRI